MKKQPTPKPNLKLTLHRDTVRQLGRQEAAQAHGGAVSGRCTTPALCHTF
jgi:hypothetical protein